MPVTITQIASDLEVSETRIEKWVSQGYITPEGTGGPRRARAWTSSEAFRLGAMARFVDGGVPVAAAAEFALELSKSAFNDEDVAVTWQGGYVSLDNPISVWLPRGTWRYELATPAEFADLFRRHEVDLAVVIPLKTLIFRVERLFADA